MLKQSLIYLFLSILVAIFSHYVHLLVVYLDIFYTFVNLKLSPLFSNTEHGILLRNVIILTCIPILITAIPALIYRAIKGGLMPYYYDITWMVWLVIVISKIIL